MGASTRGRLGLSEVVALPPAAGVPGTAAGAGRMGVVRRPRVVCGHRGAAPRPMARGRWSSPALLEPGGRLAVPPAEAWAVSAAMGDESPSRGRLERLTVAQVAPVAMGAEGARGRRVPGRSPPRAAPGESTGVGGAADTDMRARDTARYAGVPPGPKRLELLLAIEPVVRCGRDMAHGLRR